MCCHTEIEVAIQTCCLTQSHYETRQTSLSTDPVTQRTWQGSHQSTLFSSHWFDLISKSWNRTLCLVLWRQTVYHQITTFSSHPFDLIRKKGIEPCVSCSQVRQLPPGHSVFKPSAWLDQEKLESTPVSPALKAVYHQGTLFSGHRHDLNWKKRERNPVSFTLTAHSLPFGCRGSGSVHQGKEIPTWNWYLAECGLSTFSFHTLPTPPPPPPPKKNQTQNSTKIVAIIKTDLFSRGLSNGTSHSFDHPNRGATSVASRKRGDRFSEDELLRMFRKWGWGNGRLGYHLPLVPWPCMKRLNRCCSHNDAVKTGVVSGMIQVITMGISKI